MYPNYIKPFFDFISAFIGFILASPIFLLCAIALAIVNKGTPFFTQLRPGKDGKLFAIYKFKTMTDAKDANGNLLPDAQRLTKIGTLVRKTSLDELPQLFNVLRGELSFTGPRPLLPEYIPLYNDFQKRRHEVKPGISGWAQVNGRNAITWDQKFALDVYYVDHMNFWLDVKIVLLTAKKVFVREGISQTGQATAEAFKGNE
ncbi:MAG: sugar transferase [Flavobacteriales bacterium]|nr:sugar transferase [Flavobacteriales bacterium]